MTEPTEATELSWSETYAQKLHAAQGVNRAASKANIASGCTDAARLRAVADSFRTIAEVYLAGRRAMDRCDMFLSCALADAAAGHERFADNYDGYAKSAALREAYRAGDQ